MLEAWSQSRLQNSKSSCRFYAPVTLCDSLHGHCSFCHDEFVFAVTDLLLPWWLLNCRYWFCFYRGCLVFAISNLIVVVSNLILAWQLWATVLLKFHVTQEGDLNGGFSFSVFSVDVVSAREKAATVVGGEWPHSDRHEYHARHDIFRRSVSTRK